LQASIIPAHFNTRSRAKRQENIFTPEKKIKKKENKFKKIIKV